MAPGESPSWGGRFTRPGTIHRVWWIAKVIPVFKNPSVPRKAPPRSSGELRSPALLELHDADFGLVGLKPLRSAPTIEGLCDGYAE